MRAQHANKNIRRLGFTIIELLLYVSVAAVMLLLAAGFLGTLLQSRVKNQAVSEVEDQGARAVELITQTMRNAIDATVPAPRTSGPLLSLVVATSSASPTIFDSQGGALRITEGAAPPVLLTSSRVALSGLVFQNLARLNTSSTVRVQFTLSRVNPGGKSEYDYSRTFFGSANIRR